MPASDTQAALPGVAEEATSESIGADICVIGAGPGGLATAALAAAFGRKVVLVERSAGGGLTLNHGSIDAEALAASAARVHAVRTAETFGIAARVPDIDMRAVSTYIREVVAALSPNFSLERYTGLGVRVIRGAARFVDKRTIAVGDLRIRARRFVIAAGTVPLIPSISGLVNVPYFTNETIFAEQDRLHSLIILGGGPTALELAQSYSRLGSRVMVLEAGKFLPDEDPELAAFIVEQLGQEGVGLHAGASVERVEGGLGRVRVHIDVAGDKHVVEGSHLLLAMGRKPATADLGLEAAGIRYDERGIKVDGGLKTSNRRVFAIGEVTGGPPFAQVAEYHAGVVVRAALFHKPVRVDARHVSRVVFTDPGLAYVGLDEVEAAKRAGKINVLRWSYRDNDRAQIERAGNGHVKVITRRDGRILGAGIAGARAAELIAIWSLAVSQGLNIKAMTEWGCPYPTFSEINKRAAASYYASTPTSPKLRKVIDFLAKFG